MMKNYTGHENCIHTDEKEAYRIKDRITFLDTTDKLRHVLYVFYKNVIGNTLFPEEQLPSLYKANEDFRLLLDWAWLEHVETQQRVPNGEVSEGIDPNKPDFLDYSIDSYYPQLQVSLWPKERRERFYGNVLFLSQEEVYREDIFFTELFCRKNIREWKDLLDSWLGFALDEQGNISRNFLKSIVWHIASIAYLNVCLLHLDIRKPTPLIRQRLENFTKT